MNGDDVKRCSKCRRVKPVSAFGAHRKCRDGLRTHCKPCHATYKDAARVRLLGSFHERHPERAYPARCSVCHLSFIRRRRGGNLQLYCSDRCKNRAGNLKSGVYRSRWNAAHPGWQKSLADRRKLEVFDRYGGSICSCCGETELAFLTIDHINGGGNNHRRQIKTFNMYAWLRRNHWPTGFRVLCMNCNWASRYGPCPHTVSSGHAAAKGA